MVKCVFCGKQIKGLIAWKDNKRYHGKCLRKKTKKKMNKKEALTWLMS